MAILFFGQGNGEGRILLLRRHASLRKCGPEKGTAAWRLRGWFDVIQYSVRRDFKLSESKHDSA